MSKNITKQYGNSNKKQKRTAMHEALRSAAYNGVMGEFFKAYREYGKAGF